MLKKYKTIKILAVPTYVYLISHDFEDLYKKKV